MTVAKMLQQNFDVSAISASVHPFNTWNEKGEFIQAFQIIVLDAQDRFMFIIGYAAADEYVFDGYVNYDKILRDYVLTKEQWEEVQKNEPARAEVADMSPKELALKA